MIFVTLGTQDKKFTRLLKAIQKQIDLGNITDDIVVQAGCTNFKTSDMKIYGLMSMEDFDNYIDKCNILITHGGVGSIITGLKKQKKIIAAARLKKYKEHVNDHQLQIIENFVKEGYILELDNFDELDLKINELKSFVPKEYKSNNETFIKNLKKEIDLFLN